MGLFSKKPGGTKFGNLLRGITNKASGGILGTGANMIALGQTKTNAQLAQEAALLNPAYVAPPTPIQTVLTNLGSIAKDVIGNDKDVKKEVAGAIWSKYKWVFIGVGAAFVTLISLLILRKKGNGKSKAKH